MIDEKFIEQLPTDFNLGVQFFITSFKEEFNSLTVNKQGVPIPKVLVKTAKYNQYIEFYFAIEAYLKANRHSYKAITLTADKNTNIANIESFFNNLKTEFDKRITLDFHEESKVKYDVMFNNVFRYEFTEGDLSRIQKLINELRDMVAISELFSAEHQQRILKRLEKLQSELHKKVSDLDKFWGLIGDAGVAIGKFGNDVKPIIDRIKEITDIVWRTQAKAEELPSGTSLPLLTDKTSD